MVVAVLPECSLPPCLFHYSVGIYIFPCFPACACCRLLASVYVAVILLQCMLPSSSSILSVSLGTVLAGLGFDCTACVAVFLSLSVSLGTVLVGLSLYCCCRFLVSFTWHSTCWSFFDSRLLLCCRCRCLASFTSVLSVAFLQYTELDNTVITSRYLLIPSLGERH